jgi:hypothetical protein
MVARLFRLIYKMGLTKGSMCFRRNYFHKPQENGVQQLWFE